MKIRILTPVTITLLFLSLPAQADYVRSYRAALLEKPVRMSDKITSVKRGQQVEELEISGNWVKVKSGDLEGWIMRMKLSKSPVKSRISLSSARAFKVKPGKKTRRRNRMRTRVARAVIGVKGLREGQVNKIKEDKSDFTAVAKVETFVVDEEEATSFLTDYTE